MLDRATFAFLVMTAEEKYSDGSSHARENVIHEAGLFQGKLGTPNAILLVESGCAVPSNLQGLTHIPFPSANIRAAFHDVRRLLEARKILTVA
jgi:predicted nucleotide-binding protein